MKTKALCGDSDNAEDGCCMGGVCTCAGCGDGEVEGDEECDDGLLNGTFDSPANCSRNCRVVACGNGILEGDEECDDGNDERLDGCDNGCRYEFAHRISSLKILKDVQVPEWCTYRNNRIAEAFVDDARVMGGIPFGTLASLSSQLSFQPVSSDYSLILHILNSADTSMKTRDDDIAIGLHEGYPYTDTEDSLDAPFRIEAAEVDLETRLPAENHSIPAMQLGGGKVFSREPRFIEMSDPMGATFGIHGFMVQMLFEMSGMSKPRYDPSIERDASLHISSDLRLPEVAGQSSTGTFCGAVETAGGGFALSDGVTFCCKNRGNDIGKPFQFCPYSAVLGEECDSYFDLLSEGCTICVDPSSAFSSGPSCELMETDPDSCFTIIKGIDFDVDSDGDGKNDTWSVLFGFETQRIRIYDLEIR